MQCNLKNDKPLTETPSQPLAHSLARESEKSPALALSTSPPTDPLDADLARLMALWPELPELGRKLLVTTAETLAAQLPRKAKRKRQGE